MSEQNTLTGYPSIDKPWLKYYSEEAINSELPQKTLYQFAYDNNVDYMNGVAFRYFGKVITYGDFFRNVQSVSKALSYYGIQKGDIVTIMSMQTPETIYVLYALNYLGAVANIVYLTLSEKELADTISSTKSKMLFILETVIDKNSDWLSKEKVPIITLSLMDSAPIYVKIAHNMKNHQSRHKFINYKDFVNHGKDVLLSPPHAQSDDLAVIVYTSGTTGEPKGVMLNSNSLNSMISQIAWTDRQDKRGDSVICNIPIFFGYGLGMLHLYISTGWDIDLFIILDSDAVGKEFNKIRPSRFVTGPPWLDGIMKHVKGDMSYCLEITGGGAAISPAKEKEFNEFLKNHGAKITYLTGYGMTEFASVVILSMKYAKAEGSIGAPLVHTVVKIEDVDTREELTYGETGEICISTPNMMLGYYNNVDATNDVIKKDKDGVKWLRTGDLGYVGIDGLVYLKGRIKRIYMTRGSDGTIYKIFCQRIEELFESNHFVNTCGVIVKKDDIHMNIPIAYVTQKNLSDDPSAIILELQNLAAKELPEHMRPAKIVIAKELPLTASGKIDYQQLEKGTITSQ